MRSVSSTRVALVAALVSGILAGCGSQTSVPLADVPQKPTPPAVDPKTLPRNQRPGPGSSAGLDHPPNQ